MKPIDIINKAILDLKLSETGKEKAILFIKEQKSSSQNDGFLFNSYYKEWINDTIYQRDKPIYQEAKRNPDDVFLRWLSERISSPYWFSRRIVDSVKDQYGEEIALLFSEVKWQQEIAWAQHMRLSNDDKIAIMGELFLESIKKDAGKIFKMIVAYYIDNHAISKEEHSYLEFSIDDIMEVDINTNDFHYIPLWLEFSHIEFKEFMEKNLTSDKIKLLAKKIRSDAKNQYRQSLIDKRISYLLKWRPVLMVSVLQEAIEHNMSSDDLLLAEKDFLERIKNGEFQQTDIPLWKIFIKHLPKYAETASLPDEEESQKRLQMVSNLTPDFLNEIPTDFKFVQKSLMDKLSSWFEAIKHHNRIPPKDFIVDFGLWIFETHHES